MPAPKRKTTRKKKAAKKTVRARVTPAGPGSSLYVKVGAAVLALVLVVMWVGRMQDIAYRKRLHRELAESPAYGEWYLEQCDITKKNAGPAAVWHGRVTKLTMGKSPVAGGAQELRAVRIGKAILLAGAENRDDSKDEVFIDVTGYPLTYGMPVAGERWIFAVSHTRDGHNKVYSALPRRQ